MFHGNQKQIYCLLLWKIVIPLNKHCIWYEVSEVDIRDIVKVKKVNVREYRRGKQIDNRDIVMVNKGSLDLLLHNLLDIITYLVQIKAFLYDQYDRK